MFFGHQLCCTFYKDIVSYMASLLRDAMSGFIVNCCCYRPSLKFLAFSHHVVNTDSSKMKAMALMYFLIAQCVKQVFFFTWGLFDRASSS